jgi:hypothetical protein
MTGKEAISWRMTKFIQMSFRRMTEYWNQTGLIECWGLVPY